MFPIAGAVPDEVPHLAHPGTPRSRGRPEVHILCHTAPLALVRSELGRLRP